MPARRGLPAYPCPLCTGMMEVTDSRPTTYAGERTIRRRRTCAECNHRFTTYEISEDNLGKRLDQLERLLVIKDRLVAALTEAVAKIGESLE